MSTFLSKMFDVGDLPVPTIDNQVLKWPVKLYIRFFNTFFTFFRNPVFESLHTFSRTLIRTN